MRHSKAMRALAFALTLATATHCRAQPPSASPPAGRPLVQVEVVCGGGFAAMRGSQAPYMGCYGALKAVQREVMQSPPPIAATVSCSVDCGAWAVR